MTNRSCHTKSRTPSLVAAPVAKALVLGPVDRVRLDQDRSGDLVVVEVLVLRGVRVQLRAIHASTDTPTNPESAQSASTSPKRPARAAS
jgi:hypothetical protein